MLSKDWNNGKRQSQMHRVAKSFERIVRLRVQIKDNILKFKDGRAICA